MAAQMAADGGLRRLFEKPLPENPTLLEALSAWNHRGIHPKNPVDPASFTEIFGELHFQEKPDHHHHRAVLPPSPPAPAARQLPPPPRATTASSWADAADQADKSKDDSSLDALLRPPKPASTVKRSASFCMKSLLLCTEGLGSESTVDADDMFKDGEYAEAEAAALGGGGKDADGKAEAVEEEAAAAAEEKRPPPTFPPPIRSIGRVGKPSVCFRSFRTDGRFVLMEVVIPGKELLQAYREGGRLRLQFADGAAAAATGVVLHKEMNGQDHGEGKEL